MESDATGYIAQYQTVRIRSLWTNSKRVFAINPTQIITLDPSNFKETHAFDIASLESVVVPEDSNKDFVLNFVKNDQFRYSCDFRAHLLCQLYQTWGQMDSRRYGQFGPFGADRLKKNGERLACQLIVRQYGLCEINRTGDIVQQYKFFNVDAIGKDEGAQAVMFVVSGRCKIYFGSQYDQIFSCIRQKLAVLGIFPRPMTGSAMENHQEKLSRYRMTGLAVASFQVVKFSGRHIGSSPCIIDITEQYLVDKHVSTFAYRSARKLLSIFALVRSWQDPREFCIEYVDGSSSRYHSSDRDSLLASILDLARSVGNGRIIVTGRVSDNLRLLPRFTQENYESSIKDAFFGADSIEAWFLKKLHRITRSSNDISEIVMAASEFNANVELPGLSTRSDMKDVKNALIGLMKHIDYLVKQEYGKADPNALSTMLQSLSRIIPCNHGYRSFLEIKEMDVRIVMYLLLHYGDDFVNYDALVVLIQLCKCPFEPRNAQQEFANRQTLLTPEVLGRLMDLLTSTSTNAHVGTKAKPTGAAGTATDRIDSNQETNTKFPNSLVISAVAELLDSLLASRCDTTSPELYERLIDLLAQKGEAMVNMLRSSCPIITENASVLMNLVMRKRKTAAEFLLDASLSEGLVLIHFYHAIFSPSRTQRFISRFLSSVWLTGDNGTPQKLLLKRMLPAGMLEFLKFAPINELHESNLDLLEEEYFASISGTVVSPLDSPHTKRIRRRLKNLLYLGANVGSLLVSDQRSPPTSQPPTPQQQQGPSDQHRRTVSQPGLMGHFRKTDSPSLPESVENDALDEEAIPQVHDDFENFRVMFHMTTQNHNLPDLIWNEQTRLELRTGLEREMKSLEREQKIRGPGSIAWNHQQFFVLFQSLADEIQVGNMYLRFFLSANDSFLRTIENPPPMVLFEKLFRRVLSNVGRDVNMSILCIRCLEKLYSVCKLQIGQFDDMLILVRLLGAVSNIEFQHTMMKLIVSLCKDDENVRQLVDAEVVEVLSQLASYSHLSSIPIGNLLMRATSSLLIADSPGSARTRASSSNDGSKEEKRSSAADNRWGFSPTEHMCPKIWFVCPPGPIPPPANKQKGPFRVSEILEFTSTGDMDGECLVNPGNVDDVDKGERIMVDTGKWKPLKSYHQLRTQLLSGGNPMFSPTEIAMMSLQLLVKLAVIHKSVDCRGIPYFPIPLTKRLLSDRRPLSVVAQSLLSTDATVIDVAAKLLNAVVEHNEAVCGKMYLTGTFFFACRYTGNNIMEISRLLFNTHMRQNFEESAVLLSSRAPLEHRSILGSILPPGVINILYNYGHERFADVFRGNYDTPEVIWNFSLREFVVEMLNQHIGDFPVRLQQFTYGEYEYCPLPKIRFESLDKEVFCSGYYLRNLCDEVRFPDWPIAEPLELLRQSLEAWRKEMAKSGSTGSVVGVGNLADARNVLGLKPDFGLSDLRKAYRLLARRYHPDKNPDGREIFEKIQKAYEQLSDNKQEIDECNLENVALIIKTEAIVYRRFGDLLKDQKFPVYNMLCSVLTIPRDIGGITELTRSLMDGGSKLMYYSSIISDSNAEELIRMEGVAKLHQMIRLCKMVLIANPADQWAALVLVFSLKCLKRLLMLSNGQNQFSRECKDFAEDFFQILHIDTVPLAVENCTECIGHACKLPANQIAFQRAGIVWKLVPFLLAYDSTLRDEEKSEDQRQTQTQQAANCQAEVSARALGMLAGQMMEEYATEEQPDIQLALNHLLTIPISKLLRNRRPNALLTALNENCETPVKIWNSSMRKELIEFDARTLKARPPGSRDADLNAALSFQFTQLREELCVGGVYVRIFAAQGVTRDIDSPSEFCRLLLDYIKENISSVIAGSCTPLMQSHFSQAADGLRAVCAAEEYIVHDIARFNGVPVVYSLLDMPESSPSFQSAVRMISQVSTDKEFSDKSCDGNEIWRLIRCLCQKTQQDNLHSLWLSLESIGSIPKMVECLLNYGSLLHILGIICSFPGYTMTFENRVAAGEFLAKLMRNPARGQAILVFLRVFLPDPLVYAIRRHPNSAVSKFDEAAENPELVWNREMQSELRVAVSDMIRDLGGFHASKELIIPPGFKVRFKSLACELFVGGVYVRLFLKNPTFELTDSVFFLEKLVENWEASFQQQMPSETPVARSSRDVKTLVLGSEDYLGILTSCIVCLLRNRGSLADNLNSWGFTSRQPEYLKLCIDREARGGPLMSIVRIMCIMADRVSCVEQLATLSDPLMLQFKRALDPLMKESSLIAEALKKILQSPASGNNYLSGGAISAKLHEYLMTNIVSKSDAELSMVDNPSVLRIHAIDILKSLANHPIHGRGVQETLDQSNNWEQYKHQKHDLFITDESRVDKYLTNYPANLQLLLTDDGNMDIRTDNSSSAAASMSQAAASSSNETVANADNPFVPPMATSQRSLSSMTGKSNSDSGSTEKESSGFFKNIKSSLFESKDSSQGLIDVFDTTITKSDQGLGLDLENRKNVTVIKKLKQLPAGVINPAARATPREILPGDVVRAVNGVEVQSFRQCVDMMREASDVVTLTLVRRSG